MHADLTQLKNFLIDSSLISAKDLNAAIEEVGENEKKVEDFLTKEEI